MIKHYTENAGLTLAEIEQFRKSPAWPERVATAHTIPRELQADEQYRLDPGRFKDLHLPILLLLGGDSPEIFKDATELANAALPNSQIAVMPGQQHIAMYTTPELFVSVVLQFLQPELTASPEVNP